MPARCDSALDLGGGDGTSTELVDVDIYLGIGLALLGQVGVRVLGVVADLAIERSTEGLCRAAAKLVRRRAGSDATPEPTPEGQVLIVQLSDQVTAHLPLTAEQARMIVAVQLAALAEQAPPAEPGEDDACG